MVTYRLQFVTYISRLLLKMSNSQKTVLDRAIGRPAMMGFMVLLGTYLATGQLIPGFA